MKVKVKSLSRCPLFATPWTVAYQAPPSMGFSRQECLDPLLQGIFPTQESNPGLRTVGRRTDALPSEPPNHKNKQAKQWRKGQLTKDCWKIKVGRYWNNVEGTENWKREKIKRKKREEKSRIYHIFNKNLILRTIFEAFLEHNEKG